MQNLISSLAPPVPDSRGLGFRAVLGSLKLPPNPKILDIGAGGFAGQTTTIHLLELENASIHAVEIDPARAEVLRAKFGDRIKVFARDFAEFSPKANYDLIVLDLDSSQIPRQFEEFLSLSAQILSKNGIVVALIIYNCEIAFDPTLALCVAAGREAQESFMQRYFGATKLTPELATERLGRQGFTVLGIVDKWMCTAKGNAVGWIVLEKIST